MRSLAFVFLLVPSLAVAQETTIVTPIPADIAVTTNSDGGAEVAVATKDHISHIWESAPGAASAFPWTQYKPGGSNVVMGRDRSGRIMIAWLNSGHLMLMTEPYTRSSLAGPAQIWSPSKLKVLRIARRPSDGSLILAALTKSDTIVAWRQQDSNSWTSFALDDLAGHDLVSISVAAGSNGRFAIVATGKDKKVYWRQEASVHGPWTAWSTLYGHDIRTSEIAADANGRLQVVALGGDKRLYFTRQDPNGVFPDWGLVSTKLAGTAFRIGQLNNGALTIWGNSPGYQDCSGIACSASEWIPANPVFTENGPNGDWGDGGIKAPGAQSVISFGRVVNVTPVDVAVILTTTTTNPGFPGDGPSCPPSGVRWDGSQCVPPSGPSTSTSSKTVSDTYAILVDRNGTPTTLTTQKP